MWAVFEIIKIGFFAMTIIIGVFKLRRESLWAIENNGLLAYKDLIEQFMMPGYLLLCGLMIGYLIAQIWIRGRDDSAAHTTSILIKSFLIGLILGIVASIVWIII